MTGKNELYDTAQLKWVPQTTAMAGASGGGTDSVGGALPAGFDNYSEAYGYTGDDLTTIVRTGTGGTYTQTLTYTSGKLTAVSRWVKS